MKRYNYQALLRQRSVVAALTIGLLAAMLGTGIELYVSTKETTVTPVIKTLTEPLDPLLDLNTIEQLEQKRLVTVDEAREGVLQNINANPPPGETATRSAANQ